MRHSNINNPKSELGLIPSSEQGDVKICQEIEIECGSISSRLHTKNDISRKHNTYIDTTRITCIGENVMTLCECGCGQETNIYRGKHSRFIIGHNLNIIPITDETRQKLSKAGMGNQNAKGHRHTDEAIQKIREAGTGRKHTVESRLKMSEAQKGNKNFLGRTHTEEAKQKISAAMMGNTCNVGRVMSEETKKKISDAQKGDKGNHWMGGISFEPYCPKFNDRFKEEIREMFNRECFLCGKSETMRRRGMSVRSIVCFMSCEN